MDRGTVWQAAVDRGYVTDQQIVERLASRFTVGVARLAAADWRVASLLPESVARKYQVVALGADDRSIRVATADPRDLSLEQTLAFVTGREVVFLAAAPAEIAAAIERAYRPDAAVDRLAGGLAPAAVEAVEPAGPEPAAPPAPDESWVRLVDALIGGAVRERASEIQVEAQPERTSVRYHIDGLTKEVLRLPASAGGGLVRRIKRLARLDPEDGQPQTGRIALRIDGVPVELRVAAAAVARGGEGAVIRLLDRHRPPPGLAGLELGPEDEASLVRTLDGAAGLVLVAGPAHSGKTTTLYAALERLKARADTLVTVEDPVEGEVPGVAQVEVNEAQGFGYPNALRSVLRQDPDVVLVGELRDAETAGIAVQAALSGHLVLSTLAVPNPGSAIARLRELGIDDAKLAAGLEAVVGQRLVRRLCDACAAPVPLASLPERARPRAGWPGQAAPRRAVGCKSCGGSGFRGVLPVLEILPGRGRIAEAVARGEPGDALAEAARRGGRRTLWQAGLERVWRGQTSFDELVRALGGEPPESGTAPAPPETAALVAPTAAGTGAAPGSPAPPRDTPPAVRILIADDDAPMRRLIRMVLEHEGYDVLEAGDGLEVLDAIESRPPDLLILDLEMPRLDGFGVLEELRARVLTASVPVIVLTAQAGEAEVRVLDLGAQDFLAKPVQPAQLQARVRAVLRRTRMA